MLVLTRRPNESIVIGSDIVVTVLEVRGDHVRIGIDAPRSMPVHRHEVFTELVQANADAAASPAQAREALASLPLPDSDT